MVWYPEETVPDDYSVVRIAHRASSRRPGVFDKSEPTFQDKPTAQKQVWKPTGMAGMSAPPPLDDEDDDFVTMPKQNKSKPVIPDKHASKGGAPSGKQTYPAHNGGNEPTTPQLELDFLKRTESPKRCHCLLCLSCTDSTRFFR